MNNVIPILILGLYHIWAFGQNIGGYDFVIKTNLGSQTGIEVGAIYNGDTDYQKQDSTLK
jgi:hypothetical protein